MTKCKCGCGLDEITSEIPYEYKRPEVGTMNEVKPEYGDIVAACWEDDDAWEEYTYVKQHPRYGFECFLCNKDGVSFIMPEDKNLWSWRIISRAQPGPVRTVTTTQIIPGQYGCVKVHDPGSKYVRINVDSAMDVEALTAAITTLTAIRDAMQTNTTA